jgi:hypothetical protein
VNNVIARKSGNPLENIFSVLDPQSETPLDFPNLYTSFAPNNKDSVIDAAWWNMKNDEPEPKVNANELYIKADQVKNLAVVLLVIAGGFFLIKKFK